MKKWIIVLAALLAAAVCTAAFAEDAAEPAPGEDVAMFDSMWVSRAGEVSAYYMDGYWIVQVTSADGRCEWSYRCMYDVERKALVSDAEAENTKTVITIDDEGSELDRATEYTDGAAEFTLTAEGKLVWKDLKEDAGAGAEYEKIGWYAGMYACGDYTLNIFWDIEETDDGEYYSGYKVNIEKMGEGVTIWTYVAYYSEEDGSLRAPIGDKEHQEKEGDPFLSIYNDGSAVFTKDAEGNVLWEDETENAGDGLVFVLTNG